MVVRQEEWDIQMGKSLKLVMGRSVEYTIVVRAIVLRTSFVHGLKSVDVGTRTVNQEDFSVSEFPLKRVVKIIDVTSYVPRQIRAV